MSDEEELEKFEITDYDLAAELDPRRFYKKQTKKQAIYGVFAPDSDDDDDRRPGFGRHKDSRKNYAGGVAFISAGIQNPVEKPKEATDEKKEDKEDSDRSSDTSSEDEFQVMAKTIDKVKTYQDFEEFAGIRKPSTSFGKGKGAYGIGEKMALKMGYQPGKGLGKDLQGIAAPIEAVVRKGRGAIGAYGREAKAKPAESPFLQPDAGTEKKQSVRDQKWKKDGLTNAGASTSQKQPTDYRYITADEVLQQRHLHSFPDAGHLAKTKVIDMTGMETRILSGYHAIAGHKRPEDEDERSKPAGKFAPKKPVFDMPELRHNINLILDTCEQDILKNDKKAKYAADRKIVLKAEQIKLGKILEQEKAEFIRLEKAIQEVKKLQECSRDLESTFITLATLKRNFEDEWELYELYNLVPAIVAPQIKTQLATVNLIANSHDIYNLFLDWKSLLGGHNDTIDTLIWEAWMPSFRAAFGYWNVKNADTMLGLVENWRPLLPTWIYQNILEQMILPKINEGVEAWDPLSDNIPIHAWIHPWLPLMSSKLEIVYPTIRRKLSNALVHWHPSDVSGKQILTPWASVFTQGSMDTFLLKNIMPKLQVALQQFVINPINQTLDQWNWVMEWQDLMPTKAMINLLENFFFPKWHQFLINWLNQNPNYEEVLRWYTWWRSLFPERFMRDVAITDNVQKALQMINASIQAPGQTINFNYILHPAQPQSQPLASHMVTQAALANALKVTAQIPHGFRDLVQMKCEELGLLFLPIPNRYYEGKQVYKCGNALIYISANVIYVFRDGIWTPTSLQQMISWAHS